MDSHFGRAFSDGWPFRDRLRRYEGKDLALHAVFGSMRELVVF